MGKNELINCRLTKKQLEILNNVFCVYENGTKTGEIPLKCDECILREIEWSPCTAEWEMFDTKEKHSKEIVRDLCFAIWHDKILTKNPKHYHHKF